MWVHLVACYLIRWLILSGRVLIRSDINMERKHQFTPMGNRRRKAALRGLRAGWWPNETRRVGTILKRFDAIWKSRYVPIMHLLFRLIWWPFCMFSADIVDKWLKKRVREHYVLSSSLKRNHESHPRCKKRTTVLKMIQIGFLSYFQNSKFGGYQKERRVHLNSSSLRILKSSEKSEELKILNTKCNRRNDKENPDIQGAIVNVKVGAQSCSFGPKEGYAEETDKYEQLDGTFKTCLCTLHLGQSRFHFLSFLFQLIYLHPR